MADARPRRRSIFSGVLLILLGTLFLLHNFRPGFHVWELFSRWWPVLLIFLGLAKLYDHLVARRSGEAAPRTITGGEILLLVLAMMLAAGVGGFDWMHGHGDVDIPWPPWEHPYSFSEEIPAKQIPADARITVRTDHGDITIHSDDTPEIRVVAKKTLGGSDENDAQKHAQQIGVTIAEIGGGYEVRPENQGERIEVDLEVQVPKKTSITARTGRGAIQIAGIQGSVTVASQNGDIEVRNSGGDVSVEGKHGDLHVIGSGGNVRVAGKGGQVEISDIKGEAAIEGEFFGPIRMEKVAKGARFVSKRTDLTVSQLAGRVETGSGTLQISDAPGNVSLTTKKNDVVLENIGGRIHVDNREGNVELRFAQPPREDVDVTDESGNIEVVLPPWATFELHAESRSGDIDNEFRDSALNKTENAGNSKLEGKVGPKGPHIRLKTTYGTIKLRKGQ